ncbi:ribosome-associated translation inhibitor RaiA [soil metagenome]
MKINIQSIHFKASKRLISFTEKKVEKLIMLDDSIIHADVSYKAGSDKNPDNKICAVYLSHPGENQYVKKSGATYEESLLQALLALEKILRRSKTKKLNHRQEARRVSAK